jgi:hypothetical protein
LVIVMRLRDKIFAWCLVAVLIWAGVPKLYAQFSGGGTVSPCSGDLNSSCQVVNLHTGVNRVLCSIRAANFNSTADQACAILASVTAWAPTSIVATNCTGTFKLAAGGVYPATSKGGTALVAAAQAYTALTGSAIVLGLTLAANIATTRYAINTVYLSLTTAAGSAATCDFYVIGNDLT